MKRLAAIGAVKLSDFLKNRIDEDTLREYLEIFDVDADEDTVEALEASLEFDGESQGDQNIQLIYYLGGRNNEITKTLVELACLRYLFPISKDLLDKVSPNNKSGVTMETAARIAGIPGPISDYSAGLVKDYFTYETMMVSMDTSDDYLRIPLRVDARLAGFMSGFDILDNDLGDNCILEYVSEEPKVFAYREQADKLYNSLDRYNKALVEDSRLSNENLAVIVSGEKGSGRTNLVRYLFNRFDIPVLIVDYDFLIKTASPLFVFKKIVRESILIDGGICISHVYKSEELDAFLKRFLDVYSQMVPRPIFFTCSSEVKLRPLLEGNVFTYDFGKCSATESYEIWKGFFDQIEGCEDINLKKLSSKMTLTPGQIKKITDQIYAISRFDNRIPEEHEIYKLCYQVLDDGRYDSIKRVEAKFTIDDLKISERNISMLHDICAQVENRQQVYDDWNMGRKYAYGRCISVILAGPPGTGKTMAVHALSNELGLELYKVDLSQIADKYVGETEKRLEEVFTKAEKSNMILFFDEADAVMGKRSETKDAHDKYTNTQIAFILQRMEEYDGIVILATNYLQNIDSAFMRRIKYVVNVGMPENDVRKEIWKSSFAPEVPIAADVDFDYLADELEISGGNIKNIVLNATFYAAEEKSPVTMYHVMKAVFRENTKDKKGVVTEDFGKYSYLVKNL